MFGQNLSIYEMGPELLLTFPSNLLKRQHFGAGRFHFKGICSIFEFEPLIFHGICKILVLELFMEHGN